MRPNAPEHWTQAPQRKLHRPWACLRATLFASGAPHYFSPRILPLLIGLFLLTGITGCSNNPHPAPLRETRADGTPWQVSYGAMPDTPRNLDPQVNFEALGNVILSQVHESLLQYNLFKTDPFELEPALAAALPIHTVNPDGTETYEFRLKRGIFFQDDPCFPGGKGRELKASDFVYTFQRIADPKVESPVFSMLQSYIAGLTEAYEEAKTKGAFDYSKPIGAITVIDDYTFRLNLKRAYPQILFWMAMNFTVPTAREAVEYYDGKNGRDQFRFHPVGTGPFKIAELVPNRIIRLVRNDNYTATQFPTSGWKPEDDKLFSPVAGAKLPFVDEVQIAMIRESIPNWLLFRQGYLDRNSVRKDNFGSVMGQGLTLSERYQARGVRMVQEVEPVTFWAQFNMDDPLVGKNKKLRQAISTAYNQTLANNTFFNGLHRKAEQILPPGFPGYDPNFINPYRTGDLEQAAKLLAEAGYPGGIDPKTGRPLEIRLDVVAGDSSSRQRAEFDKAQIDQLGINCIIQENTWARFQDKIENGLFQVATGSGWGADYPDPENYFFLLYSKNTPPQGHNTARYSNPEFDALFEKMATMDNGPERTELVRKMNAILIEDCPLIYNFHRVNYFLSQPWVLRGVSNSMVNGGMKYTRLDPLLRLEKQREWNHTPWWPTAVLAGGLLGILIYAGLWARRHNR
jgi:oligopeptide transport system substrate-binding protein